MIKYLGSKRVLIPRIRAIAAQLALSDEAPSALDPFTGTTRVAQALRAEGYRVDAGDTATYAATFARCYIESALTSEEFRDVEELLATLSSLDGFDGYVTQTFHREARYFQLENAMRIDAIRGHITSLKLPPLQEAIALTSLIEAADRVDSTAGVQMAYLKSWARRSYDPLMLRMPEFIEGPVGRVFHGDASGTANAAGPVTLAYLDPPYNQHSYLGNYHVWETLARGDAPEAYGVARKRQDVRERKSAWNSKRAAHAALRELVGEIDARWILCSFNVEGHIGIDEITETLAARTGEQVAGAALPHPRYVGARIGIHDHRGERVGTPGALETTEWLLLAGPNAYELMQRALPEDVVVADPARPRPELAPR